VREGEWVWWELGGGEFEKKSFAVSLFGTGMWYNGERKWFELKEEWVWLE